MKCDQRYHQLVKPLPAHEHCPIDRMKACHPHGRRITDVMQPSPRHQEIPGSHVEIRTKSIGSRCDTTDVCKSARHSSKECLRHNSCMRHLRGSHGPTIRPPAAARVSAETVLATRRSS